MLRRLSLSLACAAGALGWLLGVSNPAGAASVQVFTGYAPWGAPNDTTGPAGSQQGSPSFNAYALNAATALQAGYNGSGAFPTTTPFSGSFTNTPAAYSTLTGINPSIYIISSGTSPANLVSFNSWAAMLNPGTNFGPAFANEIGSALQFGVRIQANPGDSIRLADLALTVHSMDSMGDTFGAAFPVPITAGGLGYTYGNTVIGFDTAGNIIPTGSPDTTPVNSLFFPGIGITDIANSMGTPQARLDAEIAFLHSLDIGQYGGFTVTGTYNVPIFSGPGAGGPALTSGPITVALDIPEPTSLAIWAGLVGVGGMIRAARRRRRSHGEPAVA